MKNPFLYGTIAEKDNFIDRASDREFIENALYAGTNIILVSPRRWGKTSLVKQAMTDLKEEHPEVIVITIDAFPITSSRGFYTTLSHEVLAATASHMQLVVEYVSNFLQELKPNIVFSTPDPKSNFSFGLEFPDRKINEKEILELAEKIAIEKNLQIVICIDEFQKMAKFPDFSRMEDLMRSVWQHQQHVSYCLYGERKAYDVGDI